MQTTHQQWATAYTWATKMRLQYGTQESKEMAEYLVMNCHIKEVRQLYAMVYLIMCMERELESNNQLTTDFA